MNVFPRYIVALDMRSIVYVASPHTSVLEARREVLVDQLSHFEQRPATMNGIRPLIVRLFLIRHFRIDAYDVHGLIDGIPNFYSCF